MRTLIALLLTSVALNSAPVTSNLVTLNFTMNVDTNQLGGLTPSQFGSNFTAVILSATSVTTPTNQYQVVATVPAGPLIASQGSPGTVWTNQLATDTSTRFYLLQWTNTVNGGAGPFSVVAPYFYLAPSGTVAVSH